MNIYLLRAWDKWKEITHMDQTFTNKVQYFKVEDTVLEMAELKVRRWKLNTRTGNNG